MVQNNTVQSNMTHICSFTQGATLSALLLGYQAQVSLIKSLFPCY